MNCPRCERDGRRTTSVKMVSVLDPTHKGNTSGITMLKCPNPNCGCTLRMSNPASGIYDIKEGCD